MNPSTRYTTPSVSEASSDADNDMEVFMQPAPPLRSFLGIPRSPRPRSMSLPPLSSEPDLIYSSPIVGKTPQERQTKQREKSQKRRAATLAAQKAAKEAEEAAAFRNRVQTVFAVMDENGLSFGDLCEYIFNPANEQNSLRYDQFFRKRGRASRILNWWLHPPTNAEARREVHETIVAHMRETVHREASTITRRKILQNASIDSRRIQDFNLAEIQGILQATTPTFLSILKSFTSSTKHQNGDISDRRKRSKSILITSCTLQCLGEYSHANSDFKKMLSLFFYASGATRQSFTILNHLGITESFSNLTAKGIPSKKAKTIEAAVSTPPIIIPPASPKLLTGIGTLHRLSSTMRGEARKVASGGLYVTVYDNINFMKRTSEQIIGRNDTQENGTCATIYQLFDADIQDMQLSDFHEAFFNARELHLSDILHSPSEASQFKSCLIHTILRIIVRFGGEGFRRFENDLTQSQPTLSPIPVHQTSIFPLPTWNIDESSISGNAEVEKAIREELDLKISPNYRKVVRIIAGDQLSVARMRSVANIRAGKEGGETGLNDIAWMPGLFHVKMADNQGFFATHWGKSNSGVRNPGSLAFHNTQLFRHPITPTSLPPFRTCRDLIFTSLYGRVLHCLLLVSGKRSLSEYQLCLDSFDTLHRHATLLYNAFVNPRKVEELRSQRAKQKDIAAASATEPQGINASYTEGDMVFENAILFLRDALISRELTDAIKSGDHERVLLALRILALSFRGNGRTKYAYEMLQFIHNVTVVWPRPFVKIVLKNFLVNTKGKKDGFSEADLLQEHFIMWIKTMYKALGSNGSWAWLEMIAPCVQALRCLVNTMTQVLGTDNGSRHAPSDLSNDIQIIMNSLREHRVYQVQKGRVLDDDDPVPDVIAVGMQNLTQGSTNPLTEYNKSFKNYQARRRMTPVIGGDTAASEAEALNPVAASESLEKSVRNEEEGFENEPVDTTDGNASETSSVVDEEAELDPEWAQPLYEDEPELERASMEDVESDMDTFEGAVDVFDEEDSDEEVESVASNNEFH